VDLAQIERAMRSELDRAKAITAPAAKEGRGLTDAERKSVDGHLERVKELKAEELRTKLALDEAAGIRGKVGEEDGFKSLARQIVAAGRGEVRMKALTQSADNDQLAVRVAGITGLPEDTRYIFGLFESSDPGTALSITDFRMVSRSVTESGSAGPIERDPLSDDEKAELDVEVDGFTADLAQLAVMCREIPNALLKSEPALGGLLGSEMRKALNRALDAHVVAAIAAASPDAGGSGSSVEELVRSGITAMQAKGVSPNVVVLNPEDAETVDLHTAVDSIVRFPFGLRVVVSTDVEAGAPLLIDTSVAGHLYQGGLEAASDPYTGFSRNTTQIRSEFNCLMVVRNADAFFIADGSDGS
jgi:hypothetical protein